MEIKNCRVAIHNLGCKVNSYESEAMQEELRLAGASIVPWEESADIYIVNTCSVTGVADRKSRQMLHRARARNPKSLIVAAGCYVQSGAEALIREGAADLLLGNNRKGGIVRLLKEYPEQSAIIPDIATEQDYEKLHAGRNPERARAFLKVQDGCSQYCSYCIIPYVRGPARSRPLEDAVREAETMLESGYREIVLNGIHLSSYGLDFAGETYGSFRKRNAVQEGLLELIEALAGIRGSWRLRLGSLEPGVISREFARRLSLLPVLCPHFHLSLQSGSDRVLRAMNRHYNTDDFRRSVDILREFFPDAAITTDIIVGFPGESEEDFEESCRFVEEIGFYELHVFKYSRRQGTAAERLPCQIAGKVKSARSDKMIDLSERLSRAYREKYVGKEEEVLIEEEILFKGKRYMSGFGRTYIKYLIPQGRPGKSDIGVGDLIPVKGIEICDDYILA